MNEHQFFKAMHLSDALAFTLTREEAAQQLKVVESFWAREDQRQLGTRTKPGRSL